jgi:hypothetical protein
MERILSSSYMPYRAGILDALSRWNDPAAQVRLARMHGRLATPRDALLGSPEWHDAVQ